jgi:hypothetical protein
MTALSADCVKTIDHLLVQVRDVYDQSVLATDPTLRPNLV